MFIAFILCTLVGFIFGGLAGEYNSGAWEPSCYYGAAAGAICFILVAIGAGESAADVISISFDSFDD